LIYKVGSVGSVGSLSKERERYIKISPYRYALSRSLEKGGKNKKMKETKF